jgi:hypothetical protein
VVAGRKQGAAGVGAPARGPIAMGAAFRFDLLHQRDRWSCAHRPCQPDSNRRFRQPSTPPVCVPAHSHRPFSYSTGTPAYPARNPTGRSTSRRHVQTIPVRVARHPRPPPASRATSATVHNAPPTRHAPSPLRRYASRTVPIDMARRRVSTTNVGACGPHRASRAHGPAYKEDCQIHVLYQVNCTRVVLDRGTLLRRQENR